MPRFPTERARRHIEELAARHRVTVAWMRRGQAPDRAQSYPALRIAICPRPTNGLSYLICLHELGHCVSSHARRYEDRTDPYGQGLCEGAAWAWAAANRDRDIPIKDQQWWAAGALLSGYWAWEVPQEAPAEDHVPSV